MNHRLVVTTEVFAALEAHLDYIAIEKQSPLNAQRWLTKAWTKLKSLRTFPHRCPPAPENEQFGFTVRMLVIDNCLFTQTENGC